MNCYFRREVDRYIAENRYLERIWEYDGHNLYTVSIKDKKTGAEWVAGKTMEAEVSYEGLTYNPSVNELSYNMELMEVTACEVTDSIYTAPYLEIIFHLRNVMYGVELRRHVILYEEIPAMRTFIEVKSHNLPKGYFYDEKRFNVLDSYPVAVCKEYLSSVQFYTCTDNTNELVKKAAEPWGFNKGNLLFYCPPDHKGFFILKESPCYSDQRPEVEGDFHISASGIQTLGWGIRPEEMPLNEYRTTYSSVIGVFQGTYEYGLAALRRYQGARAHTLPERDYMLMANPWGDRNCMEHMGEEFVLRELEACQRLGVTHYQLDDGWQKGNGLYHLVNNEAVDNSYWEIDKERFPHAFEKVAAKAQECGVELALWFAPDFNRLFRNHEEQAQLLYSIYKKYHIRKFKIDAVQLRNKEAEENLERLLKTLRDRSHGDITFNLDTTADARAGYFMFQEYGNIFLENRYTDWKNYYPYLTLKNLWDICSYVPTQKLQIEFLNIDRNKENYPPEDVLAPRNYSYEYVFAVSMFANPLCWFEPSALGEEALRSYRSMIDLHKKYRDSIFAGQIFPIGERPDGYSWTGFQSHNKGEGSGFIIAYRERTPSTKHVFKLLFLEEKKLHLHSLTDHSSDQVIDYREETGIEICMEEINSYKIYRYEFR